MYCNCCNKKLNDYTNLLYFIGISRPLCYKCEQKIEEEKSIQACFCILFCLIYILLFVPI